MKLKEAFRAQNLLAARYREACELLQAETFEDRVVTRQFSKANLGNDVVESCPINVSVLAGKDRYNFDKLVNLAIALAEEKEKLIIAIENAKLDNQVSFDALKQSNVVKQMLIYRLSTLATVKTYEKVGTDQYYGKDNDGKPAVYPYPTNTVVSYDIDKKHLRAILRKLEDECNNTSLALDEMLVSVEVDFTSRFDYNSPIEDIYLDF